MKLNLDELIEAARAYQMTPEETRQQVISFAYGNVRLHNPAITRADIEAALEKLENQ